MEKSWSSNIYSMLNAASFFTHIGVLTLFSSYNVVLLKCSLHACLGDALIQFKVSQKNCHVSILEPRNSGLQLKEFLGLRPLNRSDILYYFHDYLNSSFLCEDQPTNFFYPSVLKLHFLILLGINMSWTNSISTQIFSVMGKYCLHLNAVKEL
jgi:hypothetical protein